MTPFLDYYKILQVHPDASKEVIQAAYKRLSKIYHPDVCREKNAQDMMSLINSAYSVLNNDQKRTEFHKLWQKNTSASFSRTTDSAGSHTSQPYSDRTSSFRNASQGFRYNASQGNTAKSSWSDPSRKNAGYQNHSYQENFHNRHQKNNYQNFYSSQQNTRYQQSFSPQDSRHPAFKTLEQYFHCLRKHRWNEAYQNLTSGDKEHATQAEFSEWQNTVLRCYEMINYAVKYYKTYRNCKLDGTVYEMIIEYCVTVTDSNVRTLENSTETLHKYVAFNGYSWKVCLGMSSLKPSILRYRLLAEKKGNYDPMDLYHNAVRRKDPLTGLFSESGFYEDADKEVYRYQRYQRPFSLIVFHVKCENPDREPFCLCHCATVIQKNLRKIDIPARLENNRLICLLAETPLENARRALNKFITLIYQNQPEEYHVITGIAAFQGYGNIKDAVYAACSEANIAKNEMVFTQYE